MARKLTPYGCRSALVVALVFTLLALPMTGPAGASPACRGPLVVVLHDIAATASSTEPLVQRLRQAGRCVLAPEYGHLGSSPLGGMARVQDSAREVASVVGSARVDLVGFGVGSLVAQRIAQAAPDQVRTLVAVGGAWRGTNLAFLGTLDLLSRRAGTYQVVAALESVLLVPFCGACPQVIAHSDYLQALNRSGPAVPGVRMVNLVTRYDELVVPYTSGTAPGMVNLVLQELAPFAIVDHFALPGSAEVGRVVLAVLGVVAR